MSKSPEEIFEAIKDIPGWFELEDIKGMASLKMPDAPVIYECGTYYGRSATAMTLLWPDAIIVTCDPDPLVYQLPPLLPEGVAWYGHKGIEVPINHKKIDMLFIDDNHTYDTIKENFNHFEPSVKKGGYIVFHDYCFETSEVDGVRKFVDELGGCRIITGKYGLAIYQKP